MSEHPFRTFYNATRLRGGVAPSHEHLVDLWPKEYGDAPKVELPNGKPEKQVSLWDALLKRRSRRDWDAVGLRATEVGALCEWSAGVTGHVEAYGYARYPLRAFPSAGGLQSTEMYLTWGDKGVKGVEGGVFHYQAVQHSLERVGSVAGRQDALRSLRSRQPWINTVPPVLVVLTVAYGRMARKYGESAGRLAAMEVGWLGQNLYLVGEALGLAVCAIHGIDEEAIARMIGLTIEREEEYPMLVMGVGRARAANV